MRNRKRGSAARRRRRRWLAALIALPATIIAVSVLLTLPLRWFDPATTSFMLQDDSGREPLLHEWLEWDQLGDAIVLAAVAAEDQKFATHFGIDWESIQKSIDSAGRGARLRGASTITQQVAKNLYLWPGRSYLRKGIEVWFALLLEAFLPKRRILEIYLNVAEFGPGVYGAGAASRYYFGKPAARLRDDEAALLAAVLPSPRRLQAHRPSDYVRERQRWILGQMRRLRREAWLTTLD